MAANPDNYGVTLPGLRAIRRAAFLSTGELAERAGLSRNVVIKAEGGGVVRMATARKLASALGTTPARLAAETAESGAA